MSETPAPAGGGTVRRSFPLSRSYSARNERAVVLLPKAGHARGTRRRDPQRAPRLVDRQGDRGQQAVLGLREKSAAVPSAARRTILRRCTLLTKNAPVFGSCATPSVTRSFSGSVNATAVSPTGVAKDFMRLLERLEGGQRAQGREVIVGADVHRDLLGRNALERFQRLRGAPVRAWAHARL